LPLPSVWAWLHLCLILLGASTQDDPLSHDIGGGVRVCRCRQADPRNDHAQAGDGPKLKPTLRATVWVLIACGAAISLRRGRFWTAVLLLGMLLALGAFTPVYGWVMRIIPGMSSMRAPARFLFVVALAAAMLAGHAFDRVREAVDDVRAARRVRLVGVAVAGLALALPLVVVVLRLGDPQVNGSELAWAGVVGGVLSCILAVMVGTALGRPSAAGAMSAVVIGLIALDLGWANVFTLEVRPADSQLSMDACGSLAKRLRWRTPTFSPSYSLPQQSAIRCPLELADGVGPPTDNLSRRDGRRDRVRHRALQRDLAAVPER
jgi:hypothetical protein